MELAAPVEMRVIEMNFEIEYYEKIFEEEWLYKIEVLDEIKMEEREGWLTPEEYEKSNKIIGYSGFHI